MTDRDRLIELIERAEGLKNNDFPSVEEIADYILANDVVKVVRCKDCKYSRPRNKSEKNIYFEDVLICESCEMADEPCAVCETDYCSYGELKEREGK